MGTVKKVEAAAKEAAVVGKRTHSITMAAAAFCAGFIGGALSLGKSGVLLNGKPTGVKAITGHEDAHRVVLAAATFAVNNIAKAGVDEFDKIMAAAVIADTAMTIIYPHSCVKSYIVEAAKKHETQGYSLESLHTKLPELAQLL